MDKITKIMIVSNLNPVAIEELFDKLMSDIYGTPAVPVSAQFNAIILEKKKHISYTKSFYPATRVLSRKFIKDNLTAGVTGIDTIICFGTLDEKTKTSFDTILGYKNSEYEDYLEFDETTNETNIKLLDYNDCDSIFEDYSALKKFLLTFINFKRKEV